MVRQLRTALFATIALIVLLGLAYPLVVTGIAQAGFHGQANDSLVSSGGHVVGSRLIGQSFTDAAGKPLAQYFQPRPSAAGTNGYDPTSSGGTNLGPTNPSWVSSVTSREADYRTFNGLPSGVPVPIDAVTASGSGVDPDISVANARDQANRVARARGLDSARVLQLVNRHIDPRPWGFLGEDTVNVLDLNLALDAMHS